LNVPATDGNTSTSTSAGGSSASGDLMNSLWAPDLVVYHSKATGKSQDKYSMLTTRPGLGGSDLHSSIQSVINNYGGVSQLATAAKECYLKDNQSACANATTPMVDMNTARFLAKIYKNTHDKVAKKDLEDVYEQYVTYHILKALQIKLDDLLDAFVGNLDKYTSSSSAFSEGGNNQNSAVSSSIKGCAPIISKNVREFSKLFNDGVEEYAKSSFGQPMKSLKNIYDRFVKQNKINIKKSLERVK